MGAEPDDRRNTRRHGSSNTSVRLPGQPIGRDPKRPAPQALTAGSPPLDSEPAPGESEVDWVMPVPLVEAGGVTQRQVKL